GDVRGRKGCVGRSAAPQRGPVAATGSEEGTPAAIWREPLHEAVLERAGTGALLDLGCGAGEFARYATDRGPALTGGALDEAAVAAASAHVPEAAFLVGDAADPPSGPF